MINVRFYTGKPELRQPEQMVVLDAWEWQLAHHFGGFTQYTTYGAYGEQREDSLVYEVVFSEVGLPRWQQTIRHYKLTLAAVLDQQEVLVTWHSLEMI